MSKPLISIVVPVYNVEAYLETCMTSLLGQTYPNIEVILVDDGSTDTSGNICERYAEMDPRVQAVRLTENSGVSHARNEGIHKAKGAFISFVDPDDYVKETMLETLYQNLLETGADISVCGVEQIGFGANTHRLRDTPALLSGEEMFFSLLRHEMLLGVVSRLYPIELVKQCRFQEHIHYGEDLLFLYHLLQHVNTVSYIPDPLYCYVCRSNSTTQSIFHERKYTHSLVYEYLYQESLDKFPQFSTQLKQTIVFLNIRMAVSAVESRMLQGKQLYMFLKLFRKRIRRYCDREVLASIRPRMIAAEVILLCWNAAAFWGVTTVYKRLKSLFHRA